MSNDDKSKERDMQRLIMTVAATAILCGGLVAATSAKAEFNYGPTKNGTQCYKMSQNGWNNQGFGYWSACPNEAAAPNTGAAPTANAGAAPAARNPAPATNPNRTVRHAAVHHQAKRI
jgi:hypothetical protein